MEYLTTAEAAERWGVTARRVQTLCKNGRIEGAQKTQDVFEELNKRKVIRHHCEHIIRRFHTWIIIASKNWKPISGKQRTCYARDPS